MSITDAEKAFYESVLESPEGHSLQDLRYAYYLAALDGTLPGGGPVWEGSTEQGKYLQSLSLTDLTVDPSPGSRHDLFNGQEPSVWWAYDRWNMVYTNGLGRLAYRHCADDPTVAENWSAEDVIVDLGRTTPHSFLYREGDMLYLYFADHADQGIYVTAATDPEGTWTAPVKVIQPTVPAGISGFHTGNMCVVKDLDGTYVMFIEQLAQNNLAPDGTTNSWQMFRATGTSPTGAFTDTVAAQGPLVSLRPNGMGSVSGPYVEREGNKWVMYYHGRAWARFFPDNGYRAVNYGNLTDDTWEPLDGGRPFIRRAHAREYDQVADLTVGRHPDGHAYLFYAANKNFAPGWFRIMCTPLLPALMRKQGGEWVSSSTRDNGELPVYNAFTPRVQQSIPQLDPQGVARGGTWALDTAPAGMHGGVRRTNTSAAQNNWIAFDLLLAPGEYRLDWLHGKGPDHAIVNFALSVMSPSDFVKNITNVDCYNATPQVNQRSQVTFTVYGTEPAWARIRLMASSKNGSSSGYVVSDQGWQLARTDLI